MNSSWCSVSIIISSFILLQCFISSFFTIQPVNSNNITHNFRVGNESRKSGSIEALLKKINKPVVKTIQIDGDVIDCVPYNQQPAFDHPLLKGKKTLNDPLEIPKGVINTSNTKDNFQVWSMSGESCLENTIPIKKIAEQDVFRETSVRKRGQKYFRKDGVDDNHEHAIGYATGNFFGAKATISIWNPRIENKDEFSLSQMWLLAGTLSEHNLNSIEVGWQVSPDRYGDSNTRLFIYWTRDAYGETGCYDLDCPGFVQTSKKIVVGGQIGPVSSYHGAQYDITFHVWKDSKTRNWWLRINNENVGYWPSFLFTLLGDQAATTVEFGGEIVNSGGTGGAHTTTQMGSGRFPSEGYKKAAYIRNIELVDKNNKLYSAPTLLGVYEKPKCYYAGSTGKTSAVWGNYMYYGGPGRAKANPGCI